MVVRPKRKGGKISIVSQKEPIISHNENNEAGNIQGCEILAFTDLQVSRGTLKTFQFNVGEM